MRAALASGAGAAVFAGFVTIGRMTRVELPRLPTINLYLEFVDETPVSFPMNVGLLVLRRTTVDELGSNVLLWRAMHLADWNGVPPAVRAVALDRMLARYQTVLMNPREWDDMQPRDWDLVPQPMRTVAYRQMVAYWAGYYRLGDAHALPRRLTAQTLAAIIMSESWFEHRALVVNVDGSRDIGLAQASDFARGRIRELHRLGVVDIDLADQDYENPWLATRFAAVWMAVLLDEARGDLELATRAYHRGLAHAADERGTSYLELVQRRLDCYIRNRDAPPAWDYVWQRARRLEQKDWPWTADDRGRSVNR
jgi:hypothetical protein